MMMMMMMINNMIMTPTEPVPWCRQDSTVVHEALQPEPHHHHRQTLVIFPVGRVLVRAVVPAAADCAACPVGRVSAIAVHQCWSAADETASPPASRSTPAELFTHKVFYQPILLKSSVIFVLIYFLVLVLILVFQLFFRFSFVLVLIIFSF